MKTCSFDAIRTAKSCSIKSATDRSSLLCQLKNICSTLKLLKNKKKPCRWENLLLVSESMMSQLRKKSIGAKFAFSTIRNKVFAQVSSSRYSAYLASSISKSILARMSKTGLISTNNPNIRSEFQLWDYRKNMLKKPST